jgi:hypothetical protein
VEEPAIQPATPPPGVTSLGGVAKLVFEYPGGAKYDAEALLVDPVSVQLFVITKDDSGNALVFEAPATGAPGTVTVMTQVGALALGALQMVTGADVTPSGDVIALRTYLSVFLYPRRPGAGVASALRRTPCSGSAPSDVFTQYESIGFTTDGRGYVTVGEGANPTIRRFRAAPAASRGVS